MRTLSGTVRVALAVDRGVGQGCGPALAPVLDRRVRVDDLRPLRGAVAASSPSRRPVSSCCGRSVNGNRVAGNERVARHREPLVERSLTCAGDVRPDRVEHASIPLVRVETIVQELTQEAAALRDAEYVGQPPAHGKVGAVAEGGRRVPNGRQADARDARAAWPDTRPRRPGRVRSRPRGRHAAALRPARASIAPVG